MGRQERVDLVRNNRDYSSLLGDQEAEDEELEESEGNGAEPLPEEQEDDLSQQCQEYYERRERLKELERQRLRLASNNGKHEKVSKNKLLPYNNYGSFFGPSEPVVARRIIEDARAREEASRVAARAKEMSEQHRVSKGASSISRSVTVSRPVEPAKKSVNETARRLQCLKEARDYSFLFTDDDPTASSPPGDDLHGATKKASEGNDKPKQKEVSGRSGSAIAGIVSKPGVPVSAKQGMKVAKGNTSAPQKGEARDLKPSRPPAERPLTSNKTKVSSQQPGSNSTYGKATSGPGRPSQSRPTASMSAITNTKQSFLSASSAAQLKSLVATAPKAAISKQPFSSSSSKGPPGKMGPKKPLPASGLTKKAAPIAEGKKQASKTHTDQKRAGVVTVARGGVPMRQDQRRSGVPATTSKQVTKRPSKPSSDPRRMQKRAYESESDDDSFLDDDDGGELDVRSMIYKITGYNPNKYQDLDDEDDRAMEANFHTIQMEEKRSARIAREEDERELALIEEEERLERERARKKRKQQR